MNKQDFLRELSLFADIDSKPKITGEGDSYSMRFTQNASEVVLKLSKDRGVVHEVRAGKKSTYPSYAGLLSSQHFGNLKKLADGQRALIKAEAPYLEDKAKLLPIVGSLVVPGRPEIEQKNLLGDIRTWLSEFPGSASVGVRALVVDGPAGIGKTHLIRTLAYERAVAYGAGSPPPILHVQSRGRALTTLNDVLAGTLQRLRATLTFDQVPVLVRHGLLQIAIDGFDELADPHGYETAWGSLRDFVEDLNGEGSLILAGRDTFINAQSIRRSVKLLDSDQTVAAHLRPLAPAEARSWFSSLKWAAPRIEEMEALGLFESNSYALRPFFLAKISEVAKDGRAFNQFSEAPLTSLVAAMLDREARLAAKKTKDVDFAAIYKEVLMEVARDMADSESESIDVSSVQLIAEMVFSRYLEGDELAVAVNRVTSISLLEGDARSGTRAFPHTEIMGYFLSMAFVELVPVGDYPKAIRRGIIGRDFLNTFNEVLGAVSTVVVEGFCSAAQDVLERRLLDGRGGRNTAALLLAAIDRVGQLEGGFRIVAQQIDEAVVGGSLPKGILSSVEFSTLDARGADLSLVNFVNCSIGNLIADRATKLPQTFPRPEQLSLDQGGVMTEVAYDLISNWIKEQAVSLDDEAGVGRSYELFERICRAMARQYWIRSNGDDPAARLIDTDEWKGIRRVLEEEGVLRIRKNVPVGGPKADFYRIERASDYLESSNSDEAVKRLKERIASLDRL